MSLRGMHDVTVRRVVGRTCVLLCVLAAGACDLDDAKSARGEDTPSPLLAPLKATNADAVRLYQVVETYFDQYLALNPIYATALGDHRFDDRFGDYASASWMADSLGIEQESLERLQSIEVRKLSPEDLVTYQAFRRERELSVEGFRYPSELLAIDQLDNWATTFAELGSGRGAQPFRSTRDYDNFLARMDGFVAWADQAINNLRAGVSKGVVLPKVVVERTLPQLEAFARNDNPRDTAFWQPLLQFPAGPTVADRQRLVKAYDEKLRTKVLPAYRRLHDYLAQEYLPHARDSVAWKDLPLGDAWYAYLVRLHTTTALTPDQVHAIGLREGERLRGELAAMQGALGVSGDLRTVLDAVRADGRFHYAQPAQLLGGYAALRGRVDANLGALFRRRPAGGFEIRPVEAFRATAAPSAFYETGNIDGSRHAVVYVNTSDLAARPTYLMEAIYLHEAIPGHHYQNAMAQAETNLPRFRRFGSNTAYDEGWALYAETLGPELGLYQDPYSRFGALSMQAWRAARLVVDTGLHAKAWSRQKAIDYLRANTALGDTDIQAEVDRYIARPGQALSYEIGALKILELRRKAHQALGARFDIREFHEQVIAGGSLPLDVLEQKMDRWIASKR
jgi:uncharacterized protein (DUF885 family)